MSVVIVKVRFMLQMDLVVLWRGIFPIARTQHRQIEWICESSLVKKYKKSTTTPMVNFGNKHPIRERKIATCAGYAVEISDFIICSVNQFTFNFEVLDIWIVAPCLPQLHQLRQQRDLNSLTPNLTCSSVFFPMATPAGAHGHCSV